MDQFNGDEIQRYVETVFVWFYTLRRVYNCFTIFNSPLGTFAPGQTNACSVRHVPYLGWGAA